MPSSLAKRRPARMLLGNLHTGAELEAQFNPTQVKERVGPVWSDLAVLGLSHDVPQYQRTSSHRVSFDLAFSAFDDDGNKLDDIQRARRFLLGLCYAHRGASNVLGGAPPRVLFVWPTMFSLTAIIDGDIEITHEDFNIEGTSIRFAAAIKLKEIRDVRLHAEDVITNGTQRS